MADELLGIEQVCKELQLSKEQVTALVKQGALRGFLDQKTYKFRQSDVEKYKASAESSATVVFEEDGAPSESSVTEVESPSDSGDGSKVDLADIDSDADLGESDQTSVMAPIDEKSAASKADEDAVFEFSEDELGLSLDDAPPDSVLVADESESSLDILEVQEESSSDSATSTADFDFMEESSSSEDVASVAEVADETPAGEGIEDTPYEPAVLDADTPASASETVTDMLGDADEISDEELETLDLDDVVDTQETLLEDADPIAPMETATVEVEPVGDDFDDIPLATEGPATDTAETMPVGDEIETVGISADDVTQGVGDDETAYEDDAYAEAEEDYAPAHVATGYDLVTPSVVGNAMLMLAIIGAALGAVFVFAEITNTTNPVTDMFRTSLLQPLLNILGG